MTVLDRHQWNHCAPPSNDNHSGSFSRHRKKSFPTPYWHVTCITAVQSVQADLLAKPSSGGRSCKSIYRHCAFRECSRPPPCQTRTPLPHSFRGVGKPFTRQTPAPTSRMRDAKSVSHHNPVMRLKHPLPATARLPPRGIPGSGCSPAGFKSTSP